jgi:hypothetical protein
VFGRNWARRFASRFGSSQRYMSVWQELWLSFPEFNTARRSRNQR